MAKGKNNSQKNHNNNSKASGAKPAARKVSVTVKKVSNPVVLKNGKNNNNGKNKKINVIPKNFKVRLPSVKNSNSGPKHPINGSDNKKNQQNDSTILQTARAIAQNKDHPRHSEVFQLLKTYEKGWVEKKKFTEVLKGMIF